MKKKSEILQKIKSSIINADPEAELILFGSRARGDNKIDSDWDILILLNYRKLTTETEKLFINSIYDIELETGEVITPLIYSKNDWSNSSCFGSNLYFSISR